MHIVGELINSSRRETNEAIKVRNAGFIEDLAKRQANCGANHIDVNAGVFWQEEPAILSWLVQTVQSVVDLPCTLDSPNPKAIEAALAVHRGQAMINSISLEQERYQALLPVVAGSNLKVIALCMSDGGMPATAEERLQAAEKLIDGLQQKNVPLYNIYVDPLVQPVCANNDFGAEFLNAVEKIMSQFQGVHTMCGISNISFGLPNRKLLNQTFMAMAIAKGLDGAILNPLDEGMMSTIRAAEVLAGRDEFCLKYTNQFRSQ
ncbi:MAG: methyltetrahydrofolate cobalamin methyltransferase [Thermodesulfobacteriota bacterium]